MSSTLLPSFFLGGFECSAHRRPSGRRVDVIDATRHDHFAAEDYARLRAAGLLGARDGLRWPLIERQPGTFDFSSAQAQVQAAQDSGVQVIWDLLHYGVPDHVDVFAPDFPARFARYARECAAYLGHAAQASPLHPPTPVWLCPINELSFFAWAGGEVGYLNPFARDQGARLKRALVRAVLAGMDAARDVLPTARFLHAEPLIHVAPDPQRPAEDLTARAMHEAQFEALDMLSGRLNPELGGHPRYLDVIGANFYPYNQWRHHPEHEQREVLPPEHAAYRPLSALLAELHARYGRPLLVAETGAEDDARAPWFRRVAAEALQARAQGVPVHGVCLYPVVNHPGWDDDRHCHNGLWDYPDRDGYRPVHAPLLDALRDAQVQEQQSRDEQARGAELTADPDRHLAAALADLSAARGGTLDQAAVTLRRAGLTGLAGQGSEQDRLRTLRLVGRAHLEAAQWLGRQWPCGLPDARSGPGGQPATAELAAAGRGTPAPGGTAASLRVSGPAGRPDAPLADQVTGDAAVLALRGLAARLGAADDVTEQVRGQLRAQAVPAHDPAVGRLARAVAAQEGAWQAVLAAARGMPDRAPQDTLAAVAVAEQLTGEAAGRARQLVAGLEPGAQDPGRALGTLAQWLLHRGPLGATDLLWDEARVQGRPETST